MQCFTTTQTNYSEQVKYIYIILNTSYYNSILCTVSCAQSDTTSPPSLLATQQYFPIS